MNSKNLSNYEVAKISEHISSKILEEVVAPQFKKYKISFPVKDKDAVKTNILRELEKDIKMLNRHSSDCFFRQYRQTFIKSIGDNIIENILEDYLKEHGKMIPDKNSKERKENDSYSEEGIIYGKVFYDDFEEPINRIIKDCFIKNKIYYS